MSEQFFQQYLNGYQPFKNYWNYEDGCVLMGCRRLYAVEKERFYADFVLNYLSPRVMADGTLPSYPTDAHSLDSFHCSKALFFAYELTHELRYRKALDWQAAQLAAHPRTRSGLCWHKQIYPEQIWIDGLYMSEPFLAEYANFAENALFYDDIRMRFAYVQKQMQDAESGLYYHGMDETRTQIWANPQTGLSSTFWLRGEGWLLMALVDTLALLPPAQNALRRELSEMLCDAMTHLLGYRAENGLLCQVIDRPHMDGNYIETSGNCMIAYTLLRGAELGVFSSDERRIGLEMLETIERTKFSDGKLHDICSAAGLGGTRCRDGSNAYYLSEPIADNDPKGVGAWMCAYAERLRTEKATRQCREVC